MGASQGNCLHTYGGFLSFAREEDKPRQKTALTKEHTAFYHGLLKRGRSLVVVHVQRDAQASTVQSILQQSGAQDVERARQELHEAA